jgi:hypothetical protein
MSRSSRKRRGEFALRVVNFFAVTATRWLLTKNTSHLKDRQSEIKSRFITLRYTVILLQHVGRREAKHEPGNSFGYSRKHVGQIVNA